MNVIRKAHRNSTLLWLLAMALGLRALIAPGFMLETNGDGPLGLGIVLCEGLNGAIPLQSVSEDPHALHKHHGNGVPEDEAASGMTMTGATCGMWSTSSTFVETTAFVSGHLFPVGPDQFVADVHVINDPFYRQQPQQPRAPPVSLS